MEKWFEMGAKTGVALYQYLDLLLTADRNRWEKRQAKKKLKEKEVQKDVKDKDFRNRRRSKSPTKIKPKIVERSPIFSAMQN